MNPFKFRAFNQEKDLLDNMLEIKSMKYNITVSKLKLQKTRNVWFGLDISRFKACHCLVSLFSFEFGLL